MAFNRERFKAARVEANKAVTAKVEETMKSASKRGDYHTIDKGVNVFRMMPPHNENDPSMQPKVVYWLTCKVQKVDSNGNEIAGEFEERQRPIFDSRIHGNTPKDIIDEYIKFTKKSIFENNQDKDEQKKLLAPINGWKDKSGKWNPGIAPNQSFVCYATKGDITSANLGRLEIYNSDRNELEKLNIDDETGEPIMVDLFSDPDNGVQFVINRVVDEKTGKLTNIVSKKTFTAPRGSKPADYGKLYQEFLDSQVVPDDVLEAFSEMEPLSKQFCNAYKRKDFEKALEALQMFDTKNNYHTFDNDEFLAIVEEIDGYYPEDNSESDYKEGKDVEQTFSKSTRKKDDDDSLNLDEMTRDELKKFNKDHNLGIRILKSMSDEDIVEAIREAMTPSNSKDEEDEYEEEDDVPTESEPAEDKLPWEEEEVETPQAPSKTKEDLKSRLAKFKK